MTGYGRGVATSGETRATVEIRSVNHRFLDLKLRGGMAPAIEEVISSKVRASLERGAVSVSLHAERATAGGTRIDGDAAKAAYDALAAIAMGLGLPGPDLAMVLAQPGVVVGTDDRDDDELAAAVTAALDLALAQLDSMRRTEGAALATDLNARVGELDRLRVAIASHAASVPHQVSKRIADRLRVLLDNTTQIDPGRLAQEVAMLADRADVTEELVRLASHLDQARAMLATTGPAGRRLDFLVQEIGRELNTIGSKSALAEITSAVVDAKAQLEKIREQVQNVE
jgi:uncharacterized protein (TIGR00255 family)